MGVRLCCLLIFILALSTITFADNTFVPGKIIVKFKEGGEKAFLASKNNAFTIDHQINLSYGKLHVLNIKNNKSIKSAIGELKSLPEVVYAEPNYIWKIEKPITDQKVWPPRHRKDLGPSDQQFGYQWGLHNTGDNEPVGEIVAAGKPGADIDALKAWPLIQGPLRPVRVAVIDTGINYNHPDLKGQMWTNEAELNGKPGVDDDGNGYIDDVHGYNFDKDNGNPMDGHGHGTHCSGVIGAVRDNGLGIAGIMPQVELVALKFLSDEGSGETEGAIQAIDYGIKMKVDVMSNSWGGGEFSQALKEAIENANKAGIVFTAAAGNDSEDNDQKPHYPANYEVDNIISVAAHDIKDELSYFSDYGAKTVHVAAPGSKIISTVLGEGYEIMSGTSMATPHVSGAVGLLLSYAGSMSPKEVRERVMATSVPVRSYRHKVAMGGRLNLYNLLTDTRPERQEPDPNAWKTVKIQSFESEHPYLPKTDLKKSYQVAGAKYLRAKISKYELEKNYDFLSVAGRDGVVAQKITGDGSDFTSEYVEGDQINLQFTSDVNEERWGFVVEELEAIY